MAPDDDLESRPAALHQTVLTITDLAREPAYQAAAMLGELIEPAPDALSIFEDGSQWRIDAYFPDDASAHAALATLTEIDGTIAEKAQCAQVPSENWVAMSQAALPPVEAGRFVICGSHDLGRVPAGPNTIVVDAGEAFGTAHHATTYGCLLAIDRLTRRASYRHVLDLGTGSGVLALAMQRALPNATIAASDIDARSIEVANENAEHNGFPRHRRSPRFIVADGLETAAMRTHGPFDLIVANILANPLIALAPQIVRRLRRGGHLVLSGILVPQAPEVLAAYRAHSMIVERHDRHNGWSTIVLRNRGQPRQRRASPDPVFHLYMPQDD